jgi:hypothetical protein
VRDCASFLDFNACVSGRGYLQCELKICQS